ncbi:MAG: hypothetical protein ACE5HB_09815 [Terriglobia bacterium]
MNGKTQTFARQAGRSAAIGAGAVAAGGLLWWLLAELGADRLVRLAEQFGGYFIIVMVLLYLGNHLGGQFITVQRNLVTEQAKLSAAVTIIATRGDSREREQDIIINHLARTSEKVLEGQKLIVRELGEIRKRLPE